MYKETKKDYRVSHQKQYKLENGVTYSTEKSCQPGILYITKLSFFFFFFCHACSKLKFLGQGLNWSHSSDNARSLIHWAARELQIKLFLKTKMSSLVAQWLKDLALSLLWLGSLLRCRFDPWNGLRIQHCHSCGLGHSCGLDSIPCPVTSICHGCCQKDNSKMIY